MKTIKASFPALLALVAVASAPFLQAEARIVGITRDSEYLLFVVDTSGSMRRYEWDRVTATLQETLEMYPAARGLQVINDQGEHLFISYRNEWIPNTPANREWILEELETWQTYSSSNPRLGLLSALDRYYDPEKSIAIFLMSDDFSAGAAAIDGLVAEVDSRNSRRATDVPRVRIHTVAFPVFYDVLGRDQFADSTGADLAQLMSTLSQRNDGRFLALPSRHADETAAAASGAEADSVASAQRVLIVVDTSTNMRAPYWQQAVDSVVWLLQELGADDSFQVMTLTAPARSMIAGSEGRWLSNADGTPGERVAAALRDTAPAGTADLGALPSVIRGLQSAPDRVYLLTASDPGIGQRNFPRIEFAGSGGGPIDVLLFGAADNPQAVPFYWALALAGGGSLVAPEEDWP